MTVEQFIELHFVPEHVLLKRKAGRSHYYWMLKLILTPASVDRAFRLPPHDLRPGAQEAKDWPYLNTLRLDEVSSGKVERLIAAGLDSGYSIQTVTHIRNVIRTMFSHAAQLGIYHGANPAAEAHVPVMEHRYGPALTLAELSRLFQAMDHPEWEMALIALFTGLNIAEVCGLQWRHVNSSGMRRRSDEQWLPPRSVAIRLQSYRAEVMPVPAARQRLVSLPELLSTVLTTLRARSTLIRADDYVFAARTGAPVSQDNLATRRLKPLGKSLGIPWLSWSAFHRSYVTLSSQYGSRLHEELRRAIPFEANFVRVSRDFQPRARRKDH